MKSETLIKTMTATGAVAAHTLATFGAGDGLVTGATAATDPLLGVTTSIGSQDNGRCDVVIAGITTVKAGGTYARGDVLTSNATGQAIKSTTGTDRIIGIAMASAVVGDLAPVLLAQG